MPILACKRVRYRSEGDEAAFFDWIGRISCVTKVEGSGDTLYLRARRNQVSDANLRELLALFFRYGVPMNQLAQFETERNRSWFRRRGTYWFPRVWGGKQPGAKAPKRMVQRHGGTSRRRG